VLTAFWVTVPDGACHTPSPTIGIRAPLFKGSVAVETFWAMGYLSIDEGIASSLARVPPEP
jgi:hypothetical protein